ncbi:hypothetical protein Tco_0608116 [Tanacetum coccineum]
MTTALYIENGSLFEGEKVSSNNLLKRSIRIKLVTAGKKRWCDSIRIKLIPSYELMIDDEFLKWLTLSMCHKITLASDTSIDFQIDFSISIERVYTLVGNPVKEILLKLNLPDHSIKVKEFQRSFCHSDTERLSRSDEVLKLKYFKKDATLKLFKSTNQERYEHVCPKVTSSQDDKVYKMAKQDYAWLMISRYKTPKEPVNRAHDTGHFKPKGDDGKDGRGTTIRIEISAEDRLESDVDRSFRSLELNRLIAFDNSQNPSMDFQTGVGDSFKNLHKDHSEIRPVLTSRQL